MKKELKKLLNISMLVEKSLQVFLMRLLLLIEKRLDRNLRNQKEKRRRKERNKINLII